MALTNKLSAIGDAIREKTGKTGLMTLDEMPVEIASITTGGGAEAEPIVLTGDGNYACAGKVASAYISKFGDTISTLEITDSDYMFYNNTCETIPFDININVSSYRDMGRMF